MEVGCCGIVVMAGRKLEYIAVYCRKTGFNFSLSYDMVERRKADRWKER